jgi:hypothetical protein
MQGSDTAARDHGERPPREVMVHGRSAMDPGCLVGACDGRSVWIYPTGYIPDLGPGGVYALPEHSGECCPFAKAQAELRRRAAVATTCAELGCDMQFAGGCSVGCCDGCSCSTSVHICSRCGDSDYGNSVEAAEVRARCEMTGHGDLEVGV